MKKTLSIMMAAMMMATGAMAQKVVLNYANGKHRARCNSNNYWYIMMYK